jgi:hypothetical protein
MSVSGLKQGRVRLDGEGDQNVEGCKHQPKKRSALNLWESWLFRNAAQRRRIWSVNETVRDLVIHGTCEGLLFTSQGHQAAWYSWGPASDGEGAGTVAHGAVRRPQRLSSNGTQPSNDNPSYILEMVRTGNVNRERGERRRRRHCKIWRWAQNPFSEAEGLVEFSFGGS